MQYEDFTNQIITFFKNNGCNSELIASFIRNNMKFILGTNDLLDKIYFICNNIEIYAILIVNDDYYYWSICQDNISYPLRENNDDNSDYIIEMIINYINGNKVKNILSNTSDMSVEKKIKVLKNIKLNSNGYHIR